MKENYTHTISFKIKDCLFTLTINNTLYTTNSPIQDISNSLSNLHFHSRYELFIIENSPFTISTADNVNVFSNGIVYISPFFNHYSINANNLFRLYFNIKPIEQNKNLKYYNDFCRIFSKNIEKINHNKTVLSYVKQIMQVYNSNSEIDLEKLKNLFSLVFLEIYSIYYQSPSLATSNEDYFVKIDSYLSTQYNKNITTKKLAEMLFLSERQVSRIIKDKYGKPLSEIVQERKLYVATMLLTKTNMPIYKIITQLGYDTENYFYSSFKKKYFITPLQYRKKFSK